MLKKIAIIVSLILTISILLALGYYFYSNLPKKIVQYEGLELGITANEVMYRKGMPTQVLGEPELDNKGEEWQTEHQVINSIKVENPNLEVSSEKVLEYKYWHYDNQGLTVKFDKPNGNVEDFTCYSEKEHGCEKVNDLGMNSTETDVKKKLGKPSKETLDGLIKTIQYKNYNIEFYLKQEKVYQIRVGKIDS
jgi:hypothetical protein